ncbi:hypothetical protein VP01_1506g4 [Puccinia sorghi]|uniref:Sphingolipid long chain base-responsive protein LSP1 n=1 Tax=Puccinia sorghi TaxID=27349 RepID=A0A0L6VKT4_9BASI|nr:hypothetical protein VP01_1506g4 [Puccinia sorghi]
MTSFLSDAKARIQHTNKLSLAPKDIKNLADIISTEKSVLSSSSKLSVDYRKAAEALKEWGLNEGDDLSDILPKLSILLCHLADAQSRFSDHDGTYRIHFKSIRMREESLAALKKGKETIQSKIAGLEKKTAKLSSENKDLPTFTTRLQEARSELISLENSISIEEARLSDFKRETVREGISLRLGAMLELAEKMMIVCEFGKMLAAEVPLEKTAPGSGRAPYCASQKTQAVVEKAQRCLTEVVFNPTPSAGNLNPETSSEVQSNLSPTSDIQYPITPRQTQHVTDVSQSLPKELPPLYFDEPGVENPIKSPNAANSPSNSLSPTTHTHFENRSSLPYSSEPEASHPSNASAQASYNTESNVSNISPPMPASQVPATLTSRLVSRNPPDVAGESHERSSHLDNVFYLRGPNGVPQPTGPGNPTESIYSPSSLYSPPPSANPPEGQPYHNRYSQPSAQSSPLQYTSTLASADPSVVKPCSGPGRGDTDDALTNSCYSPRPRDPSVSSGVSGLPTTEGRTTKARAFRRPIANQASSPPETQTRSIESSQAVIAIDELTSTGASTVVQPLHINKRDTSSNYDQR